MNAFQITVLICAAGFLALGAGPAIVVLPPTLPGTQAVYPSPGQSNVCPDTPLAIQFGDWPRLGAKGLIRVFDASTDQAVATVDVGYHAEPPVVKPRPTSGPASTRPVMPEPDWGPTAVQSIGGLSNFRYFPIILSGDTATIYLPNSSLAYNKTYYVTIEPGAILSKMGFNGVSKADGWRFTTRSAPPAAGAPKLVVAPNSTGDFCTVQGAVDFVPKGNTAPVQIFIKNGTYTELVYFSDKNHLSFQGEDRKQTIIQYANSERFNFAHGTYHRGVFFGDHCQDLSISNLTIRNTIPRGGSQAEAIILRGDLDARAVIRGIDLYSFQDTLQINGQAYLADCYVEGDVDFLWGTGPCFFENCRFYGTRDKGYYTQIRNRDTNHGYVFYKCTLDGPPDVHTMFLSRIDPGVFPYSEVVLIDCTLGSAVGPGGWTLSKGATQAPDVHFWEYNSRTPDGTAVDVSKRLDVSRQLDKTTDAELIAHYSDAAWVLGNNWNPNAPSTQPSN